MQELGDRKITIVRGDEENASGLLPSKKKLAFFGLFSSSRSDEFRGKNTAAALKEFVLKSSHLDISRSRLTAVKQWAALEEKIVHDYKEQKAVQPKSDAFSSKTPSKHPRPIFDDFTTHTAVPSPLRSSKTEEPLRRKKVFVGMMALLLVSGWMAAGVFVFLRSQETSSVHLTSQKLIQLQTENKQLDRSYAALKGSLGDQRREMKLQRAQLRDAIAELGTAKAEAQVLEKKYRDELMRLTLRYESELAVLRNTVETQNAVIHALKVQGQAFEKIVDQVGMSAFSGAAAGFTQSSSTERSSISQGEVTTVDRKQGFVVINLGADQGIRSGRWVNISRNGIDLAVGLIDRVYNTMSVALVRNERMLQVIQEGDSVSLS